MEKISDLIVYRQEFLDLPWRFEPLHDPLSSPRRLMRILRPIVQPFVLAVFHVQAHVLARCAVGFELVRDHDARRPRGLLEQLPHKPLRGGSISSALNEDVENEAVLIDGAPEPMLLAGDCDDNLIEMPFIATNRRAAADPFGEFPTKLLGPAANGFMADDDPMRGQHLLNHPQAEDMTAPKIKQNAAK